MKKLMISFVLLILIAGLLAEELENEVFLGYETTEMFMNSCEYFAGEIGFKFNHKSQIRLTVTQVKLTDRQFSSKFNTKAWDDENIEGYRQGYELHYDRFFSKYFYVSASLGYYNATYKHKISDEEVTYETITIGSGLGFRRNGILGFDRLYYNFNIPVRYYFDNKDVTKLGDTSMLENIMINNLWFFIGYEF